MVTVPLNTPTRSQLQRMVGNDPDLLRAIENLFRLAGVDTPTDLVDILSAINDVEISIGATNATAITAASIADRLQNIVELLETAPIVRSESAEVKADAAFALASIVAETVEYIETGPVPVQYPAEGGAGGSVAWGAITGLIADQIDLSNGLTQAALASGIDGGDASTAYTVFAGIDGGGA